MSTSDQYRTVNQTAIERYSFNDERPVNLEEQGLTKRFLPIGCSGGGGHNTAALALSHSFQAHCTTNYTPGDYEKKPTSITGTAITLMSHITSFFSNIQSIFNSLGLPTLPNHVALAEGIRQLRKANAKPRAYIDMMLDVFITGYENAAIWNEAQRTDQKDTLKALINFQQQSDDANYSTVYHYFLALLEKAHEENNPYTDILSTQAQALPALCDAVLKYNETHHPNVVVHQYLTDLPTLGATHFFNPLSRLTATQQQCMKLYAVNLTDNILDHFFPDSYFLGTYTIDPKNNPMIRAGFSNPDYDNSDKFDTSVDICLKDQSKHTIAANETVASIMLGSQAGDDSYRYITTLFHSGVDKIFVFGGANSVLQKKIDIFLKDYPDSSSQIILLEPQDDPSIASIMTRSNYVVTRCGGLSVMEQMAMNHHSQQTIFIHHADSNDLTLASGISWEDCNADILIETLQQQNIPAIKICPSELDDALSKIKNNKTLTQETITETVDEELGDELVIINYNKTEAIEPFYMT